MKRTVLWIMTGVLAMAMSLPAQMQGQRGPRAYGDKNGDGVCDFTGKPVGQMRGQGQARGRQGRRGRCNCQCRRARARTQNPPAVQKPSTQSTPAAPTTKP